MYERNSLESIFDSLKKNPIGFIAIKNEHSIFEFPARNVNANNIIYHMHIMYNHVGSSNLHIF